MLLGLSTSAYQLAGGPTAGRPARAAAAQVRMDVADVPGLVQGQKYGPTAPAHPVSAPGEAGEARAEKRAHGAGSG